MLTSVIQKANARLKFLYRKRKLLNLTAKKLLVMSLIHCHFDYACSFWYLGLSKVLKTQLQVTPKKSYGLFLTWIQGHILALTFSSLLADYLFQKELIRLF